MAVTYSQNGVIVKPTGFDVIGGKKYKTVQMPDGKIWLAENLDFKFCNVGGSGTPTTANAWYYNNNATTYGWNGYKCGLLYNWYAVKLLNDNRADLCPEWHVPSYAEWSEMVTAIGGASTAGTKLKALDGSAGTNWPNEWGGTDNYGMAMLPYGRYSNGFGYINSYAYIWTVDTSHHAVFVNTSSEFTNADNADAKIGMALRLVRDAT